MEKNNIKSESRRDLLKTLTAITGYSICAGASIAFLEGCKADNKAVEAAASAAPEVFKSILNKDQITLLDEISERILPKTDTPGAKDCQVAEYISRAVTNHYKPEDQKRFTDGLVKFDNVAKAKFQKTFVTLNDTERDEVLTILAKEWRVYQAASDKAGAVAVPGPGGNTKPKVPPHIFKEVRDLTVTGYCTSKEGATKLLKYDPIPGPYKKDIPRSEVGGVWALT
jgi:hypothetical protein